MADNAGAWMLVAGGAFVGGAIVARIFSSTKFKVGDRVIFSGLPGELATVTGVSKYSSGMFYYVVFDNIAIISPTLVSEAALIKVGHVALARAR